MQIDEVIGKIDNVVNELRIQGDLIDEAIEKIREHDTIIMKIQKAIPKLEQIEAWRSEITSHALQIISMVIGLFAMILAVFMVFVGRLDIGQYQSMLSVVIVYFILLTAIWFTLWLYYQRKRIS